MASLRAPRRASDIGGEPRFGLPTDAAYLDIRSQMVHMKSRVHIILGIAGAVAACSLAPHYQRPDTAAAPAEYQEARDWKLATPSDTEARGPWWTIFQDTALDTL